MKRSGRVSFFALSMALFCEAAEERSLLPGTESEVPVAGLPDPIQVWVPEDYHPNRDWPVMFWYPGTAGRPTVEFVRRHTGGRGWVVVGMGFRDEGQFDADEATLAEELAILRGLRERLESILRLDRKRACVGGFSKGGWVSALLWQRDPSLASAAVLGAGWLENPGGPTPDSPFPRSAFVGIGELDGNRAMSHRAARAFADAGAETVLEVWQGRGHSLPDVSEAFRQWLRCVGDAGVESGSGVDPVQAEATDWFDGEFAKLEREGAPLADRYFALVELTATPFFPRLDEESRAAAAALLAEWAALPDLAAELEAAERFSEILERESRDRLVTTLESCREDYLRLAAALPATRYGAAAGRAAERAAELLK